MVVVLPTVAFAQDPFVVAPEAYKQQFENDWVRVVRVHYEPRQKIASHDHPTTETIYVYLRDSGAVRFTHTGESRFFINRPPVKAGGFRLGPAAVETHEVESLTDDPTDFLRVELKTTPPRIKGFHKRVPPDSHSTTRSSQKTRFENKKVRITRVTCAAAKPCGNGSPTQLPTLWIAIRPARLSVESLGSRSEWRMAVGETKWLEAGAAAKLDNPGAEVIELLRVEFKTQPATAP